MRFFGARLQRRSILKPSSLALRLPFNRTTLQLHVTVT